jgi:hypothetical protein
LLLAGKGFVFRSGFLQQVVMREHQTLWSARRVALVAALCVAAIVAVSPARAEGADAWTAIEIGGQVSQRGAAGSWQPVVRGSTLADGAWLRIGADGKLVLSRRKDTITASPSSEFQLPPDASAGSGFSILQTLGTLLFRVEHTPDRRFEVDAPYLAAVVKGTVFTVSARDTGDSVHVAEGAVEVTTRAAHEVVLIRPGQTATAPSSGGSLSITGGQSPALPPRRSETRDPGTEATGSAAAGDKTGDARYAARSDHGTVEITRTLGEKSLDIAALTKGLLDGGGQGSAHKLLASAAPAEHGVADRVGDAAGGNSNAAGGNSNAAGGNPNAGGGNANAAGGNPNAGGSNANAAGGNPNAAGGNANASAHAAANKANGHAKH